MEETDTVKLLRECDAGIKMGVSSINEVLDHTNSEKLRGILSDSKTTHEKLADELRMMLAECGDDGKDPNFAAKSMSRVKTNMKIAMDNSDKTVADLICEGCNMGVKSLYRYLNQYAAADDKARYITRRIADEEEKLAADVRPFL